MACNIPESAPAAKGFRGDQAHDDKNPANVALVFAALCTAGGLLLLARLGRGLTLSELGAGAVPLGLMGATLMVCGIAAIVGFSATAAWSGAALWLCATATLGLRALTARGLEVRKRTLTRAGLTFLGTVALPATLLILLHLRILAVEDGGLVTHGSTLTDMASHTAIVATMAATGLCPPTHPYEAAAPLHYHWLADAFSSAMVVAGGRADLTALRNAIVLPDALLSLCFFMLLWRLARRCGLGLAGSTTTVTLAAVGGGLGFFFFAAEHPSDLLSAFKGLVAPFDLWPEQGLYWTNLVRDILLHTRTAAPALCLWLLGTLLVLSAEGADPAPLKDEASDHPRRLSMMGAGIVLGMLPLLNLHIFIGGLAVTATWVAATRPASWAWILPPLVLEAGGVLAWMWGVRTPSPGALTFTSGGWMGSGDPLVFWIRNVGPLLLVGPLGGLLLAPATRALCLAAWVPFVIGNIFVLTSPWANEKLMLAWFVLACVGSGAIVDLLLRRGRAATAMAVVLLALSTPTGVFAVAYNLTQSLYLYSPEAAPACEWLSRHTPPDAVVLTDDGCATAVCIAGGRRLYAGMTGILAAHGIDATIPLARRDGVLNGDEHFGWVLRTEKVDYVLVRKHAGPERLHGFLVEWGCEPVYDDGACAVYHTSSKSFRPTVQPDEAKTPSR